LVHINLLEDDGDRVNGVVPLGIQVCHSKTIKAGGGEQPKQISDTKATPTSILNGVVEHL
jgi:hypothetical protein